jgi:hypothetical protein
MAQETSTQGVTFSSACAYKCDPFCAYCGLCKVAIFRHLRRCRNFELWCPNGIAPRPIEQGSADQVSPRAAMMSRSFSALAICCGVVRLDGSLAGSRWRQMPLTQQAPTENRQGSGIHGDTQGKVPTAHDCVSRDGYKGLGSA